MKTDEFIKKVTESATSEFFERNYSEIRYTVVGYEYLKEIYNRPNHNLALDFYFQFIFKSFYYMRYVSYDFTKQFFAKMDEIRQKIGIKELDAVQITKDLEKAAENGFQFSFVTKMLNLENDTLYPIYDSKVALMFGLQNLKPDNKEEQYREWYQTIQQCYAALQKDNRTQKIINKFKATFHTNLSDLRILDIIVWSLGKDMEKQNKILNDSITKKQKIQKLYKIGLSRTEMLNLKFVDPAAIYDFFREQKQIQGMNGFVGVFRLLEEFDDSGYCSFSFRAITKDDYEVVLQGKKQSPDCYPEAAFCVSDTPFEGADNVVWQLSGRRILYAGSVIINQEMATEVTPDVVSDMIVEDAIGRNVDVLRIKIEKHSPVSVSLQESSIPVVISNNDYTFFELNVPEEAALRNEMYNNQE